jgi:hypothetical protein
VADLVRDDVVGGGLVGGGGGREQHLLVAPLGVVAVDEEVGEDLEEPGLAIGARLELAEILVGAKEGVLDEVLGVAFVAREPERRAVERPGVGQGLTLELAAELLGCTEHAVGRKPALRRSYSHPGKYRASWWLQ